MGKRNYWTANRINFWILVVLSLGLIVNFILLIKTQNQQIIIKEEIDEVNAKLGEFETITADNISVNSIRIGNATIYYNGSCFVTRGETSMMSIC